MEPSCLAGFFMAFLLLQIDVLTQAMSLNIQINIQVPDAEGVLVECTSGSLFPPAEMTWRDSKGNVIPHSSKFDSQDGLLYLKSSILLKNRTHGPITCSIYNATTNQEKKRSIVLPDVLFKPENISLMSNRPSCPPVIYLIIILVLHCLRGILVCCLKWKTCEFMRGSNKMRLCYELTWECLPLALYIGFLPFYLNFRSKASILDNAYPLYSNWLWDVCIILVVMMVFFTGLILLLLVTLNTKEQKAPCQPLEDEILPLHQLSQESTEQRSPSPFLRDCREEAVQLQGNTIEEIFHQPQESCGEETFSPLQPLGLDCSLNWGT